MARADTASASTTNDSIAWLLEHGVLFTGFAPGISPQALKAISREVRRWRLHQRTRLELNDLADRINPIVRGWINYYGRFYRSLLVPLLKRINAYLMRFLRRKLKRLRGKKKALQYWSRLVATRSRRSPARSRACSTVTSPAMAELTSCDTCVPRSGNSG
jgi:hypothetical protein